MCYFFKSGGSQQKIKKNKYVIFINYKKNPFTDTNSENFSYCPRRKKEGHKKEGKKKERKETDKKKKEESSIHIMDIP